MKALQFEMSIPKIVLTRALAWRGLCTMAGAWARLGGGPAARGKKIEKTEPRPIWLSTSIQPECSATIAETMESPRPEF